MHASTGVVATLLRRFRRMEPDAHPRREPVLAPVTGEAALDVDGALDPVASPLEGDEEPVAGLLDLLAPMLGERRSQLPVVPAKELLPALVSDQADEVGGGHDVGEHERLRRPRTGGDGRPLVVAQERLTCSRSRDAPRRSKTARAATKVPASCAPSPSASKARP